MANRFFISREDLRVQLGPDYADIEGTFQVQAPPRASKHKSSLPITIQVPLYVPAQTNGTFHSFWLEAKPAFRGSTLPEEAAKILQSLSGIRLEYSDRVLHPRRYTYAFFRKNRHLMIPQDETELIWCEFELEAKALKSKDSFRMLYRQYHSNIDGRTWFAYTPLFSDSADLLNPKGAWLKHPEDYIAAVNAPQATFVVASMHERVLLHSSQRLVIQPKHREFIVLQITNPVTPPDRRQPYWETRDK